MAGEKSPVEDFGGTVGKAVAVTESDTTDLGRTRGLYVGVAGDLVVVPEQNADAAPITFKNVPVGFFPVRCRKVMVATTASEIVALY